jgi:hypothetical protein
VVTRRTVAAAAVAIALAGVAGCAGSPGRRPAGIPRTADPLAAAVAAVRARSDSVFTVRAGLELTWDDPGTGRPESCSASLTFERPGNLRVLARSAAFFTVFELVAGGDRVWLDVPREGITVTGRRDDPAWDRLPVAPRPLLVALLADPWAGGPVDTTGVRAERAGGELRLVGEGWTVRIDAATGRPTAYESEGLTVAWAEWALRWDLPWSHDIGVRTEEGRLRARLGRFQIDRFLQAGLFSFSPGEDRDLLTPTRAKRRWEAMQAP